jgi:hypothetical protein
MKHRRQTSEAGKGKGKDRNRKVLCRGRKDERERVIHLRLLATTLMLPASEWPRDALAGGNMILLL